MKYLYAFIAIVYFFSTTASFACSFTPGTTFDDPSMPGVSLGIADVVSAEITKFGDSGSCMTLSYSAMENLYGAFPAKFSVKICDAEMSEDVMESLNGNVPYGFVTGATVLVGLVRVKGELSEFRHYVPDCWGPFHHNLDVLSAEESAKYVERIKEQIKKHLAGE